ncbi:MAG: hypothetical protein FK733_16000 [Asgard group archaeon]|nr:hypothetical protein [Asgard group archaeon]
MKKSKKILWQIVHWIIIISFILEIIYGMVQTFFILVPEGMLPGPLLGRAADIPFELLVSRRLYAIETWIAIAGLAIYLAIVYRSQLYKALIKEKKDEKENPFE